MKPKAIIKKTADRKGFTRSVMRKYKAKWKGKKVFIKPNIVSIERYPTTTHQEVLREVLRNVTKAGEEVIVGDGPAFNSGNTTKLIEHHSLHEVCGDFDVELCNLHDEPFKKVMTKTGYKMRVSSVPFDFNYMISLPILKHHQCTSITGALKNHFGFLQNRERIFAHTRLKNIHRLTAEIHNVFKANLVIMDGVKTLRHAQEQRHGGKPAKLGYMFAGEDPVALDSAGLKYLKRPVPELESLVPSDIEHIRIASELGIGSIDYSKQTI